MNNLSLKVNWISRDVTNQLYRLYDIKLETLNCYGVYIIYQQASLGLLATPIVLRVGQGNVSERLREHRTLTELRKRSGVLVMWASIPRLKVDGVERFLANRYQPLIGEVFPNARPVPVSLPFVA